MLALPKEICSDLDASAAREWLETNGIGGYAMGTISGALTRRYHAFLTAATEPPLGRVTMLKKFEEALIIDDVIFELSTNNYSGAVYPDGCKFITGFRLDPFPVWTINVNGTEIERRIFMVNGENTAVIRYTLTARSSPRSVVKLQLRPLLSFVDYHHQQHENAEFDQTFTAIDRLVSVRPYASLPALFFSHNGSVEKTGNWYRNFEEAIEEERGFDHTEDLFQPFVIKFDIAERADVIVSTEPHDAGDAYKLEKAEVKRRADLVAIAKTKDEFTQQLVLAADQFIVKRGEGSTVIAGYPWFSDWGRDTMIALPGLTLSTGRPDVAKGILREFSDHISQGMLPNRFPDSGGEAEYNTVDATLWYFEAIRNYAETTGDHEFVQAEIYEKLADIVAWHLKGTRYNIHVDTDGLLYAGENGSQLTWMDAKTGDEAFTPRIGKPVEIQALWYNALMIMAELAEKFGDMTDNRLYLSMADMCRRSFNNVFWNDEDDCFYDVVTNDARDNSIRPNQIFAVSLPHSMIDDEKARLIVNKVKDELLTPAGLRSLDRRDSRYAGVYIGPPRSRDSTYHQGTVWAWLIGAYIDAHRRVFPDAENEIEDLFGRFRDHLTEGCVGQIAEIFDGDPPHRPRGCCAQAWSVAEVLRVLRQ